MFGNAPTRMTVGPDCVHPNEVIANHAIHTHKIFLFTLVPSDNHGEDAGCFFLADLDLLTSFD